MDNHGRLISGTGAVTRETNSHKGSSLKREKERKREGESERERYVKTDVGGLGFATPHIYARDLGCSNTLGFVLFNCIFLASQLHFNYIAPGTCKKV